MKNLLFLFAIFFLSNAESADYESWSSFYLSKDAYNKQLAITIAGAQGAALASINIINALRGEALIFCVPENINLSQQVYADILYDEYSTSKSYSSNTETSQILFLALEKRYPCL